MNNVGTGNTKTSDDGEVRGNLVLDGLLVSDVVGIGCAPDEAGQVFKVIDAKVRIRRVS